MPTYRANVRIEGLEGADPSQVRDALHAQLGKAEIGDCRILSVEPVRERQVPPAQRYPRRVPPSEGAWRKQSNAAGLVLLIAAGWTVWFFWSFVTVYLAND